MVELGLHEVLGAGARSPLRRRDRLDLDVVDLGTVCRQWVIHLHGTHEHLIVA